MVLNMSRVMPESTIAEFRSLYVVGVAMATAILRFVSYFEGFIMRKIFPFFIYIPFISFFKSRSFSNSFLVIAFILL